MTNLVLGSATGYNKSHIYNFVKSLRKYYSDDIFFIVNNNIDETTDIFLNENKISKIITNVKGKKIQKERYTIYLDFLEKKNYQKILITDVRDVLFQNNPFNNKNFSNLNFFLEDKIIEKCPYNSRWINKLYGSKIYKEIKHHQISCSGTVFGYKDGIIKYLNRMLYHKKHFKYFSLFNFGYDQGWHNFIIHKEKNLECKKFDNQSGFVATIGNSNISDFVFSDTIKTKKGAVIDVIHQYDRKKFSNIIPNIIKRII